MTATTGSMDSVRLEKVLTWGFFVALALVGLLLHRDYGISWDEPWQVRHGGVLWRFIFEGDEGLLTDRARYHGTLIPFAWTLMERFDFFADQQRLYFYRHLGNFALFYLGVAGFYLLCRRGFGSWKLALLGALLLVLSPRTFAHAFMNPKDIPFMSLFIWAVLTGIRFLDRPGWATALAHGLVCAVLINFRVLGVMAPALTLAFLVVRLAAFEETRQAWRRSLGLYLASVLVAFGVATCLWPTLWSNPVSELLNAVRHLAHFPWRGDVLYLGAFHQSDKLPWHYPLVWMAVTIPIVYLLMLPIGVFDLARKILQAPRRFAEHWVDLLVLAWMVGPVAMVIALDAVLYDGWRHLYFVYPAMLWFVLKGVKFVYELTSRAAATRLRAPFVALVAVALLANAANIAIYHPYQQVYFNRLAGSGEQVGQRFELDYWGVSYRAGLEHILATDPRDDIRILVANQPGVWNLLILPKKDRERVRFVRDLREADYFVTNYRWHPQDYAFEPPEYAIFAGGARILGVYAFARPRA